MANYSMDDFTLSIVFVSGVPQLDVVPNGNGSTTSYALNSGSSSVTVAVETDEYVIGTGALITNEDEPHKHQLGGSGSLTFTGKLLKGIGIMDLRDMGRQGNLEVDYDLECSVIRIQAMEGQYPIWIKSADPSCVVVNS